jgi:hypothetical protein
VNFVAIDSPIVSEFTGTLAISPNPDLLNGAECPGDFDVGEEGAKRE